MVDPVRVRHPAARQLIVLDEGLPLNHGVKVLRGNISQVLCLDSLGKAFLEALMFLSTRESAVSIVSMFHQWLPGSSAWHQFDIGGNSNVVIEYAKGLGVGQKGNPVKPSEGYYGIALSPGRTRLKLHI